MDRVTIMRLNAIEERLDKLEKDSHPPVDIEERVFNFLKERGLLPPDAILGD